MIANTMKKQRMVRSVVAGLALFAAATCAQADTVFNYVLDAGTH